MTRKISVIPVQPVRHYPPEQLERACVIAVQVNRGDLILCEKPYKL